MSKRKEIVLDEESEKNLDYLSKVLDMNQSRAIKWLINTMARVFKGVPSQRKDEEVHLMKGDVFKLGDLYLDSLTGQILKVVDKDDTEETT